LRSVIAYWQQGKMKLKSQSLPTLHKASFTKGGGQVEKRRKGGRKLRDLRKMVNEKKEKNDRKEVHEGENQ